MKEIKGDRDSKDEAQVLKQWQQLNNQIAKMKSTIKAAEVALDAEVYQHYPKLNEGEIKALVVEDKWLATIGVAIHGEMDRISQGLSQRLKVLAERYETALPEQTQTVARLEQAVEANL